MISQTTNADKMLQSVLRDRTIIEKIGLHPDDYCRIDDALVSDNPMTPEGVKTSESDRQVTAGYVMDHVKIGIQALEMIKQDKKTVKHLKFDY